jgi:hypothetical protein
MQEKISDEAWMKRLWKWADQYDISDEDIPKDKDTLLKMKHLNLMMVYFGLKKIPGDQWPKNISTLSKEEKKRFTKALLKKGVFPDEIGKLTQLEELCINYNYIERLPDSIVNLKNLKKVCLCHNKNLVLSFEQKLWIWELEKNGADIECDEGLIKID